MRRPLSADPDIDNNRPRPAGVDAIRWVRVRDSRGDTSGYTTSSGRGTHVYRYHGLNAESIVASSLDLVD